jgi:hypothetical protein
LAVTDLVPSKPVAGTVTTVISSIVDQGSPRKEVKAYIDTKSISIEAELLDSLTNERLAAVTDQKVAQKHKLGKSAKSGAMRGICSSNGRKLFEGECIA